LTVISPLISPSPSKGNGTLLAPSELMLTTEDKPLVVAVADRFADENTVVPGIIEVCCGLEIVRLAAPLQSI
jgi:hypothetical protein